MLLRQMFIKFSLVVNYVIKPKCKFNQVEYKGLVMVLLPVNKNERGRSELSRLHTEMDNFVSRIMGDEERLSGLMEIIIRSDRLTLSCWQLLILLSVYTM